MRSAVEKICAGFGDDYWLARDRDGEFPEEFRRAISRPAAGSVSVFRRPYGGSGLGITEAAIMMRSTIAASGAETVRRRPPCT